MLGPLRFTILIGSSPAAPVLVPEPTAGGNVLFSGHSLVNTTMPNMFDDFQEAGETTQYSVINGSPMVYRWENAGTEQGVNARTVLATGDIDHFVITEAGPIENYFPGGSSETHGPLWYDAATDVNTSCRFWLYATWPGFDLYPVLADWLAKQVFDYSNHWVPLLDHINNTRDPSRPEARMLPMGSIFWTLNQRIGSGLVTSLTSITELFEDEIHLLDAGDYMVAIAAWAVINQQSPVGLPSTLTGEFGETYTIDPDVAADLQATVWAALTNDGYTGLYAAGLHAVPDAPPASTVVSISEGFRITLAASPDAHGNSVYKYGIRYSSDGGSSWSSEIFRYGRSLYEVIGLTPGIEYLVQTRAYNAVGVSAWSASATVTPSAASTATPVAFDGTADYLVKPLTNAPGCTIATRIRFTQAPINFGFIAAAPTLQVGSDGSIITEALNQSFGAFIPNQTAAPPGTVTAGAELAIMLTLSNNASLSGGVSGRLWINGEEVWTSTATTGSNILLQYFAYGAQDSGSMHQRFETDGLWVANEAVDPAVHWDSIFSVTNDMIVDETGVVAGVTPDLFQTGNAAAWNSGTDNVGNTYTLNGSVTDA